ncbi:MAG: hypothetical protein M1269_10855 [Chloroflexi bacterium]|nr:hypothetical protein [Chloroflexota bacterium]
MEKKFRVFFFLGALVVFLFQAYPCHADRQIDGFSAAKWGMTQDAVKQALSDSGIAVVKSGQTKAGDLYLVTKETLYNTPIGVGYYFDSSSKEVFLIRIVVIPDGGPTAANRDLLAEQQMMENFTDAAQQAITGDHGIPVSQSSDELQQLSSLNCQVLSSSVWTRDWEPASGAINLTSNKLSNTIYGNIVTVPELRYISPGRYYPNDDLVENYSLSMEVNKLISQAPPAPSTPASQDAYNNYMKSVDGQIQQQNDIDADKQKMDNKVDAAEDFIDRYGYTDYYSPYYYPNYPYYGPSNTLPVVAPLKPVKVNSPKR